MALWMPDGWLDCVVDLGQQFNLQPQPKGVQVSHWPCFSLTLNWLAKRRNTHCVYFRAQGKDGKSLCESWDQSTTLESRSIIHQSLTKLHLCLRWRDWSLTCLSVWYCGRLSYIITVYLKAILTAIHFKLLPIVHLKDQCVGIKQNGPLWNIIFITMF